MIWKPWFALEIVETHDGRYSIKRKVYDNDDKSAWWIEFKPDFRAKIKYVNHRGRGTHTYKTLEEAIARAEEHARIGE